MIYFSDRKWGSAFKIAPINPPRLDRLTILDQLRLERGFAAFEVGAVGAGEGEEVNSGPRDPYCPQLSDCTSESKKPALSKTPDEYTGYLLGQEAAETT